MESRGSASDEIFRNPPIRHPQGEGEGSVRHRVLGRREFARRDATRRVTNDDALLLQTHSSTTLESCHLSSSVSDRASKRRGDYEGKRGGSGSNRSNSPATGTFYFFGGGEVGWRLVSEKVIALER